MKGLHEINRMRLAAGLPIDPKHEITEKKVTEAEPLEEARKTAQPMTDFCLVGKALPHSTLPDVYHATNLRGLINIIKGSSKEDLEALQVFHHDDHIAAEKLAKKLIRDAKKQHAHMKQMDELIVKESVCPDCEKLKREDPDAQAAWKLKSQADHLKKSQPQLAQAQMNAAKSHLDKFNAKKADIKCKNCKKEQTTESVEAELNEFVIGSQFASWDKDEKAATNAVAPNKDDVSSDNKRDEDKDESPQEAPGDLGQAATDAHNYDAEKKIAVPTKITALLKAEIKQAEATAEKMNYSNRDAAYFHKDLAAMFQDLLNHMEGGTVHDIKQAQIFMTSLMGPMLHKIPADVVNYLARGGESASLKSYMKKV